MPRFELVHNGGQLVIRIDTSDPDLISRWFREHLPQLGRSQVDETRLNIYPLGRPDGRGGWMNDWPIDPLHIELTPAGVSQLTGELRRALGLPVATAREQAGT